MATIRYKILDGVAPITVSLIPSVAPDQVKTEPGSYYFTNVPDGNYIIRATDATGCYDEVAVNIDCSTSIEDCVMPEGVILGDPIVVSIEYDSPKGLVELSSDLITLTTQFIYYFEHIEDVLSINTVPTYVKIEPDIENPGSDIYYLYTEDGCCLEDGYYLSVYGEMESQFITRVKDCALVLDYFVDLMDVADMFIDSILYSDVGEKVVGDNYEDVVEAGCYFIENEDSVDNITFKKLYMLLIDDDEPTTYLFNTDGEIISEGWYLVQFYGQYYVLVEFKDYDDIVISSLFDHCFSDPEDAVILGTLEDRTSDVSSFGEGYPIMLGQTFDICGELHRISILASIEGYPSSALVAKLYYDVPESESGYPLGDFIAQSINTVDVSMPQFDGGVVSEISFYFDNVQIDGEFICVFEYGEWAYQDEFSFIKFKYNNDAAEPYGEFMKYDEGTGYWINKTSDGHQLTVELAYVDNCGTNSTIAPQGERGYLYNKWAMVGDKDGDGVSETSIANVGWHPMTFDDMFDLIYEVTGSEYDESDFEIEETTGLYKKLMIKGEDNWNYLTDEGTNELKFNARGAGARDSWGHFFGIRVSMHIITSDKRLNTDSSAYEHGIFEITYEDYPDYKVMVASFLQDADDKLGASVRLVKDSTTLQHGETGVYTGNDGKTYPTICIGTKEWVAENLIETKFRDGTVIPYIGNVPNADDEEWSETDSAAYCVYPDIT